MDIKKIDVPDDLSSEVDLPSTVFDKLDELENSISNALKTREIPFEINSDFTTEKDENLLGDPLETVYLDFNIETFFEYQSRLCNNVKYRDPLSKIRVRYSIMHRIDDGKWKFDPFRDEITKQIGYGLFRSSCSRVSETNELVFVDYHGIEMVFDADEINRFYDLSSHVVKSPFNVVEEMDFVSTDGATRVKIERG